MENSVKVEFFRPDSDSKMISHTCTGINLKTLIAAVYSVKAETNAYLTDIVEKEGINPSQSSVGDNEEDDEEDDPPDGDKSAAEGKRKNANKGSGRKRRKW